MQLWTRTSKLPKCYLINRSLSKILIFCLSFPSRDRATAPGQYESKDAIPNTIEVICYPSSGDVPLGPPPPATTHEAAAGCEVRKGWEERRPASESSPGDGPGGEDGGKEGDGGEGGGGGDATSVSKASSSQSHSPNGRGGRAGGQEGLTSAVAVRGAPVQVRVGH